MVRALSLSALPIRRLFGADALSQPVILAVMALLTLNRLVIVVSDAPESTVEYVANVASIGILAWAVFTILGAAVNRVAPHVSLKRVALVLTTYVATGLSREILLIGAPGSTVTFIADPAARLATALITSSVLFPLMAGFIGDARRYSASVAKTKSLKAELARAFAWSEASLEQGRRALVDVVQKQLRKALAPFVNGDVGGSGAVQDRVSELTRITESIIQPLSARLTNSTPGYLPSNSKISPVRVSIGSTLDIATRTNPFRPGLYIWVSVLVDAPVFITVLNWTERFWAIVVITALGLVHLAARQFLLPYITQLRLRWRLFVVGVVYNLSLLPISVFMFVVLGGTLYALWAAGFSFVLGWVLFGISAAMRGFGLAREQSLVEFDKAAKLLAWKIARINCQAWVEQRNLATFLHGEVQSLILVAQLKIQRAIDTGEDVETVVASVQDLLRDIPSRIGTPQQGATLDLLRESLNDRWGSFLSLHIEFNDETRRAINADPVCLTVIREIFSEFVVNAVKHAQAEMVKLVLGVVGDRVEIVFSNSISATDVEAVADASSGASAHEKGGPSVRVGVGSQLIESVLLDRQLTTTSDEYRLSGALPLQETLPSATI
jgi:signal transduction histidine kinase